MQLQRQALESAKQALIGHSDECKEVNDALVLIDQAMAEQPAQRTWVGLTDEETGHWAADFLAGAKWAEAKLKEKNT